MVGGPLADSARLALTWFVLAGIGVVIAVLLTALKADALLTHHAQPAVLSLTHAWVAGFLMSATFGAVYQLLPVVVGVPLLSERIAWIHLGLHGLSVLALIPSFWFGRYEGVAIVGVLTALGAVLYAVNVTTTVMRAGRSADSVAWAFAISSWWLVGTVLLGVLLAANRRWGLWAGDPLNWLRAHAHIGVAGFFLTLIQGAAFRLVPMFTMATVAQWGRVRTAIVCTQLGLFGLAPSLAFGWFPGTALSACVLALGIALSGVELRRTLAARRKKALDHGLNGFLGGAIGFGGASLIGLVMVFWPDVDPEWRVRGSVVIGVVALLGGLVPMVSGMLCKILPFLVWLRAYGPMVGKQLVPLAAQLPRVALERVWIEVHAAAVCLLLIGLVRGEAPWLWLGGLGLAVSNGSLWLNFFLVARHLWRPARGVGFR